MRRALTPFVLVAVALLALTAPDALAQAGGGSSGFGGGGGGGGGGFGGGGSSGSGDGGGFAGIVLLLLVFFVAFGVVPAVGRRRRARARRERDAKVSRASLEAAEDDPAFAADAVKPAAAALYRDVQRAWSERDDAALAQRLGPDLLVEWRRRLADFEHKGWVNEVQIVRGPDVAYVGLVNRAGDEQDRVTVTLNATLHSVVKTRDGTILHRDEDTDKDGEIEVCEYWTLAREGGAWRLHSIEQEQEGAHHLGAKIVVAPWSDDARLADESLVELAAADAAPAGFPVTELVSVEFDGTAHEQALDLSLADPRCAPDVLEVVARRAVEAWAEAVDGDDAALLEIATPQAARALLYPRGEDSRARLVVRGPRLLRLAIAALHAETEPLRMDVEARVSGWRYLEDRDTVAVLGGDKDRATEFTERWTFALDGPAPASWRLVGTAAPGG